MTKEELYAKKEVVQGYYNRIIMQTPTIEQILIWLEKDIEYLRMEGLNIEAGEIIKNDPHEASMVKCDICGNTWMAVRPAGLVKLQCPNCLNMCSFENI